MQGQGFDPLELLHHIDPAQLTYQEWENVLAAGKHEGLSADILDEWSKADSRYKAGEVEKKLRTIKGAGNPVTAGTLYHYAVEQGWQPAPTGHVIDWDDMISDDGDFRVVDPAWVDPHPSMPAAPQSDRPDDLAEYLRILYSPDEYVGLVIESSYDEEKDKFHPAGSGYYTRTAGEWLDLIEKYRFRENPFGWIVGDYNPQAGAWIRFNPLDGRGVNDENVTAWRYALVESDAVSVEKQYSLIQALELPVAVMVHSGGKSLHAIVRVDAKSQTEYREKVKFLYEVCDANGLRVDQNNKNPSRLSRMPGVTRGEHRQYIVARNIGKPTWQDWVDYIEDLRDELPEDEDGHAELLERPPLAPELIEGVLRQGHKMLLSGPSKAGKSFALIELATAINEGGYWFGHKCKKGAVFYVNLEVDRPSFIGRLIEVRESLGLSQSPEPDLLRLWHLRGVAMPLDKLVPKLIRRIKDEQYLAVIIDPIYKVLTGDENSASDMAAFCNQFDKICRSIGASVIYCHHHSKGQQSGKSAMDRASGSGVFARDPDALVDFLQMKVPASNQMPGATAWKISYTLREFPTPDPEYYWFKWPIHIADECGDITRGINDTGEYRPSQSDVKSARLMQWDLLYEDLYKRNKGKFVTTNQMAEALQPNSDGTPCSTDTVKRYIREDLAGKYGYDDAKIYKITS
jgi:RecA-family ATPase